MGDNHVAKFEDLQLPRSVADETYVPSAEHHETAPRLADGRLRLHTFLGVYDRGFWTCRIQLRPERVQNRQLPVSLPHQPGRPAALRDSTVRPRDP